MLLPITYHADKILVVEEIAVQEVAICKTACKAYHAIKFGGEMINYKEVEKEIIKIYYNVTRYINITNEIIKIINKYNEINKTNIINITQVLTKII